MTTDFPSLFFSCYFLSVFSRSFPFLSFSFLFFSFPLASSKEAQGLPHGVTDSQIGRDVLSFDPSPADPTQVCRYVHSDSSTTIRPYNPPFPSLLLLLPLAPLPLPTSPRPGTREDRETQGGPSSASSRPPANSEGSRNRLETSQTCNAGRDPHGTRKPTSARPDWWRSASLPTIVPGHWALGR